MRQAVIYLRVSTIEQTTANQERELRQIASRSGSASIHRQCSASAALSTAQASPWRSR